VSEATVEFQPVLTKYIGQDGSASLDHYLSREGETALRYEVAREVLASKQPQEIVQTILDSGLRGRGGAGFPAGKKWSFLAKGTGKPSYLVVNGDESEPGTFKDRYLLQDDPHQLLEGVIISAFAIDCHQAFIYLRGEFVEGYQILKKAVADAKAKGFLGENIFGSGFDLTVTLVRGAGAYICGEETGMLSSIEGDRGYPKLKPPFPAVSGLFGCPTIVNNVETIANVPHIMKHGVDWFRQWGTKDSPGFKVFSLAGHVNQPGNYEVPLGTPLTELINRYGGGVRGGKNIRAVIPGGSSTPLLTGEKIQQATMDYESIASLGSFLGSGAVTILDEDTDILRAIQNIMKFYHHESCGQCTPCREGTGWLKKIVYRVADGRGTRQDLALIKDVCGNMRGRTICALADAAVMPMMSFLTEFEEEFAKRLAVNN